MNVLFQRLFNAALLARWSAAAARWLGAMLAQNPSSPLKPVNAVPGDGAEHLMLKGHDVVAYFTQGRHALGSARSSRACTRA
jgi:hypothetical protein